MRPHLMFLLAGLPGAAFAASGPRCAVSAAGLDRLASTQPIAALTYPTPVMPAGNRPVLDLPKGEPAARPKNATPLVPPQPSKPVAEAPSSGSGALLTPSVAALPGTTPPPAPPAHPADLPAAGSAHPVLRSVRGLPMPAGVVPMSRAEIAAVPALRQIASHGAKLFSLGTVDGMRGVFARSGSLFSVFYITPDGRSEIQGEMWSDRGKNITLRQVAAIPGVLPTVTIGKIAAHQPVKHLVARTTLMPPHPSSGSALPAPVPVAASPAQKAREVASVFRMLHSTVHGTVGKPGAPHLWMLIDPMCIHSIHAMQALAPYINRGQLRLSVIPLAILDYEDKGESTVKAKVMVSRDPARMVADWIDKGLPETATVGAGALLARNMKVARYVGLKGTPTLLWHAKDGLIGRSNGDPGNLASVIASIGPSS